MPYSYILYNGDGTNRTFSVPFQYLDQSHVTVEVAGSPVTFTWLSAGQVQTTVAPPAGTANVKVKRSTPSTVTTFTSPSIFRASVLNNALRSLLYQVQEAFDQSADAFVAAANALTAAAAAATSASNAATSATNASNSATAAAGSATAAGNSATAAANSAATINPANFVQTLAQSLTAPQQAQARTNIGAPSVGDLANPIPISQVTGLQTNLNNLQAGVDQSTGLISTVSLLAMQMSLTGRLTGDEVVIDPFVDTAGVAGSSTNVSVLGGRASRSQVAISGATGTNLGSPPAGLFDNVLTGSISCTFGTRYGKDYGSARPLSGVRVLGATTRGTNTNSGTGGIEWRVSSDGVSWTVLHTSTGIAGVGNPNWVAEFYLTSPQSWRYTDVSFSNSPGDNAAFVAEIQFFEQNTSMSLRTPNYTSEIANPATARAGILVVPGVDNITPGTNLRAWVSRNGGTNETEVTLSLVQTLVNGWRYYEGVTTISGQPTGTAMRMRVDSSSDAQFEATVFTWR